MEPEIVVPTSEDKDYCHFCFGAANLHIVFPLVRPDLLSFIDNIMGISITPEAYESFSLCSECISTLDMFIKFRNKSRSHYEKVREAKIRNQAVKRMFPILRDNMSQFSPFRSLVEPANRLDMSTTNDGANPNESLEQSTSMNSSFQGENDDCTGSACKRNYTQLTYDLDPESSAKKVRIQNGTKHKTRFHHIREIMNRFRNNRLQINNVSATSPVSSRQNGFHFTNHQPLLNDNTSKSYPISCKPCVVVVKKFPAHNIDLCKL
ncbi:uncharacterized protein LOC125775104 [Anopheles funestus]|uniref:uncharacterized protein LOC125775104 n=1 Tax=Anopheles funestus TaxID=62324 RepID=UPI0020C5EE69|nr:uncharacterized protein LOC125775104 [Anopheles funestus]